MVSNPKPRGSSPKRTWEDGQRMEIAIVDDLIENPECNISGQCQDKIRNSDFGHKSFANGERSH